ncbi:envelope glycoprotein [Anopheles sinensis]|uniref:Envelope glycoprotein n=1 Tax=Anopheles sinensis TaxID=74873 RepID=A0A084VAV7_ANOSI|nr:envelope glycoprotein [Anopheles sinensis]
MALRIMFRTLYRESDHFDGIGSSRGRTDTDLRSICPELQGNQQRRGRKEAEGGETDGGLTYRFATLSYTDARQEPTRDTIVLAGSPCGSYGHSVGRASNEYGVEKHCNIKKREKE